MEWGHGKLLEFQRKSALGAKNGDLLRYGWYGILEAILYLEEKSLESTVIFHKIFHDHLLDYS